MSSSGGNKLDTVPKHHVRTEELTIQSTADVSVCSKDGKYVCVMLAFGCAAVLWCFFCLLLLRDLCWCVVYGFRIQASVNRTLPSASCRTVQSSC